MLDIEPIKKREQAATPGPWSYGIGSCDCGDGYGCSHSSWAYEVRSVKPEPDPSWCEVEKNGRKTLNGSYQHPIIEDMCCNIDDSEFFTKARTDIPALLDELKRTRAAAKELREELQEILSSADGSFRMPILDETEWLEDLG